VKLSCALVLSLWAGGVLADCRPDVADFRWEGGAARFNIEVADDAAERAKGLMFRPALARGAGMLFVYDRPQGVAFWMRNTLIPLDMMFLNAAGEVTAVHENAVPKDETPIPGPDDTLLVLEINGGLAKKLGLGPGAQLRHASVDQDRAVWPCNAP
jgi:uncharacterized membrane protein (UPF0127 family)